VHTDTEVLSSVSEDNSINYVHTFDFNGFKADRRVVRFIYQLFGVCVFISSLLRIKMEHRYPFKGEKTWRLESKLVAFCTKRVGSETGHNSFHGVWHNLCCHNNVHLLLSCYFSLYRYFDPITSMFNYINHVCIWSSIWTRHLVNYS
jgi:hypothetical protein